MDLSTPKQQKFRADQAFVRYNTTLQNSPFWLKFQKIHRVLLISSSVFVTVAICLAATLRYLFKMDFFGLEEYVLIAACVLYFFGAAQGSFERSHISADFMEVFMAERGKLGVFLLVQKTVELAMSYVFVYWGWLMIQWCLEGWPVTPVWHIPFLIPEGIVWLTFTLMAIYTTAHYVLLVKAVLKPSDPVTLDMHQRATDKTACRDGIQTERNEVIK